MKSIGEKIETALAACRSVTLDGKSAVVIGYPGIGFARVREPGDPATRRQAEFSWECVLRVLTHPTKPGAFKL